MDSNTDLMARGERTCVPIIGILHTPPFVTLTITHMAYLHGTRSTRAAHPKIVINATKIMINRPPKIMINRPSQVPPAGLVVHGDFVWQLALALVAVQVVLVPHLALRGNKTPVKELQWI